MDKDAHMVHTKGGANESESPHRQVQNALIVVVPHKEEEVKYNHVIIVVQHGSVLPSVNSTPRSLWLGSLHDKEGDTTINDT